jgi:hypothetical protein
MEYDFDEWGVWFGMLIPWVRLGNQATVESISVGVMVGDLGAN